MNDTVGKFCDSVHERLETLQGRLESLKSNIGTTAICCRKSLSKYAAKMKRDKW